MKTKQYIASQIRCFRDQRGWSQEELGLKVGVKKATISSWENGRTTPDADMLITLCMTFDVDIIDFYPIDEAAQRTDGLSPDERTLIYAYRSTNALFRDEVLDYAKRAAERHPLNNPDYVATEGVA